MAKEIKKTKKTTEKTAKEQLVGKIIHYYDKINVGIIEVSKALKKGDKIHIKGNTTDFEEDVKSMQVEHEQIDKAKKGDVIGMAVKEKVREGDLVYKV
ncbi:translation elongation factor-like protein [Patescibacteria group bacterium]|nr:translation elongation factor-like protein [Patescibacteria group bacterium]MBU4458803.1 translation elongation factor-like protein [Patescibacteria group bacterium]MCG2696393.1 translation elongation factor-like protein [Candidatus Portnoybacteria bacterium]